MENGKHIKDTSHCIVCGKKHKCVYWHINDDSTIWCYCCSCGRSYDIYEYCKLGGISPKDLLKNHIEFGSRNDNEVTKLQWPSSYISLLDSRAEDGADYIKSRGLEIEGDIYYDTKSRGIVFPMYYDMYFCGAQIRLINPIRNEFGVATKMISMPGTRTSILVYNWNQLPFLMDIKGVIITEGAFNCLSIQQATNDRFGQYENPFKCIALSGSGASSHHQEIMRDLVDGGMKVIVAPDRDSAGIKMFEKFSNAKAITHYVFPEDGDGDWNDILKTLGKEEFVRYFLGRVKKI